MNKYTILVNSCDAYSDLWIPFFTLFKKYWPDNDDLIVFNTESSDFAFDGLNIVCVHPSSKDCPYGQRIIEALNQISTEYVILFLDDFFLRERVSLDSINTIINYMDNDKKIVYFNCDCLKTLSCDEDYPDYKKVPHGTPYTLNMQAAIWRTEKLRSYWKPNVSPWEWEFYCNYNVVADDKFYCTTDPNNGFCDYGFVKNSGGLFIEESGLSRMWRRCLKKKVLKLISI